MNTFALRLGYPSNRDGSIFDIAALLVSQIFEATADAEESKRISYPIDKKQLRFVLDSFLEFNVMYAGGAFPCLVSRLTDGITYRSRF